MFFAEKGFVSPDPESTRFCLSVYEAPLPEPKGLAVTLSSFRRPAPNMAPTRAKASCLYPASGMALREAAEKGFDNAVVLDGIGNVAELERCAASRGVRFAVVLEVDSGLHRSGVDPQKAVGVRHYC